MKKLSKYLFLFLACLCLAGFIPSANVQAATGFQVSQAAMKKSISGYTVPVTVKNAVQRFVIKKNEITKIKVTSNTYSSKTNTETVKANVYINRTVAEVKVKVKLTYKIKNGKWKCNSVSILSSSISKINLKGTWKGTYVANQGITKVVINIRSVSKDGYIVNGTFNFSAYTTNPDVPGGKYTLKGGYDKATGEIAFYGNEWLEQPDDYSFCNIDAYVDLVNKKIKGSSSLDIKR